MEIFKDKTRPIFFKGKIWEFLELFDFLREAEFEEHHGTPIGILDFLTELNFVATTSEARRLVKGNAVTIDGLKITDFRTIIVPTNDMIVRVGKRKFLKIGISK